jgi:sulfate transport system substrate-binding protein
MAVSINKTTRSFLQADTMTSLKLKTLLATLALAASGVASAQDQLLNVSYDVAREFYKDYNQAFAPTTRRPPARTSRSTSRMAAPAPRRAPNDGLAADVVTFNTTTDVDFLAANGVVAKDWAKKFPNDASPTTSTMLFLVRNGNPKNIKDWSDLTRPDVKVVVVNPKTGGNGRYAYLAAWGSVREAGGTDAQAQNSSSSSTRTCPCWARAAATRPASSCSATSAMC